MERRSTLKRVAYVCAEKKLIRRSWENLDTPNRKHYQDKILLDNLEQCSFDYLSNSRQVLPECKPMQFNKTKERRRYRSLFNLI